MGFERENGAVRKRRTELAAAYIALSVLGIPLWLTTLSMFGYAAGIAAILGLVVGLGATGLAWQRAWRRLTGRITADERGLFVDGKQVVARAKMNRAYVRRADGQTYLRLAPPGVFGRPIDVEVRGEAEAQEILAALRLDAQSSVVEHVFTDGTAKSDRQKLFVIAGFFLTMMIMSLALVFKPVLPGMALAVKAIGLFFTLFTSASALFLLYSRRVSISVGADGLHVRQVAHTPRFIAFRDLDRVTLSDEEVTLHLRDRTTIAVHNLSEKRADLGDDRDGEAAGLVARIRDAHAAYRAAPPTTAPALDRGSRTTEEWIQHARDVREDAATYRAGVVPDEQLWRIVEDASASAAERAGAALALRHDLDDKGRERLRIAAEACAEKRLRVALETASSDDDAALADALEPLAGVRRMSVSR